MSDEPTTEQQHDGAGSVEEIETPCGLTSCGEEIKEEITRPSCLECVEKHLGSALVLMTECRNGYPHRLLAIGHLHEAEDESQQWPELHAMVRQVRKDFQQHNKTPNYERLAELIEQVKSSGT